MTILWTSLEAAVITGGKSTREWQATGVCISIQNIKPGDLFFATQDDDLNEVFRRGAAAAVVAGNPGGNEAWPLLKVADVYEALRALARAGRHRTHGLMVAVQGRAEREAVARALSSLFIVHEGGRHLSADMAALAETCDFAVFGFSPIVGPDIAVVTDCHHADGSVFDVMSPGGRVLVNMDSPGAQNVIARVQAAGIRNIFTFGRSAECDAVLQEVLPAANGVRVKMKVLGESVNLILAAGDTVKPELLAGALILRLAEATALQVAQALSAPGSAINSESNVALMDRLVRNSMQAAFRVMNMIDLGRGRRTVVLDNIPSTREKSVMVSNKDLDIPLRIDNLELVYACKGLSLFSNAESAIQKARPSATLEKIVPSVLAPGDFVTFKGFLHGPTELISGSWRLAPKGARNP